MNDNPEVKIEERIVLQKFNGEPLPENEFERIHIVDGVVIATERIENGEVVSKVEYLPETVKEV